MRQDGCGSPPVALVEDPPQTLFSGRSLAAGANPKPFAPTASQRWVPGNALVPPWSVLLCQLLVASVRLLLMTSNSFGYCRAVGGGGIAKSSDEQELEACIDFQTFLASLPRSILRSRTRFSMFLDMSFHTKRCGDSTATAIFPLPIPIVGLFQKQRVPKLNAKQWRTRASGPDVKHEDAAECLRLARLWDSKGLLAMFPHQHPLGLSHGIQCSQVRPS